MLLECNQVDKDLKKAMLICFFLVAVAGAFRIWIFPLLIG